MKTIRIYVRRKHIDKGRPGLAEQCAVALAVKEATKSRSVFVYGTGHIEIVRKPHSLPVAFGYPSVVDRFIDRFDLIDLDEEVDAKLLRRRLKPFSFLMKQEA